MRLDVCVYCFGKLTRVYCQVSCVCRLCCGRTIKTVKSDVEDCLPSNLMCLTWDPGLEKENLRPPSSPVVLLEDFLSFEQSQKKGARLTVIFQGFDDPG